MSDHKFTMEEIEKLMQKFSEANLSRFHLKENEFELALEKEQNVLVSATETALLGVPEVPLAMPDSADGGYFLKAPIVGTYYSAPAPDKPAFVRAGDEVEPGDILCIIESMKLMNEVASEVSGTVVEIFVSDGDPLEYGQPILRIRTAE